MAFSVKSYKEHYRRLLFLESERYQFFKEFENVVSTEDGEKLNLLLEVLKKEGKTKVLVSHRGQEGESILHTAAKFNQCSEIIKTLIKCCPELMTLARKESNNYYGQTALHVAIAKGNTQAVEVMLSEVYNQSQSLRTALLHQLATGVKFSNTVMMGELPLSVAALTFNYTMIEVLLANGAEMDRQNTKGDTVFHSLIRFSAIYPEHTSNVINIMNFLHEKIKEKLTASSNIALDYDHSDNGYIWFIPNHEDLNPLQLAATLAQDAIFNFIFKLPKVYCFLNSYDGLFDRKSYDITEIDTLATENWAADQKLRKSRLQRHVAPTMAEGVSRHKFSNKNRNSCSPMMLLQREKRKSILEIMFDIKSMAAFLFIQQPVVRQVIKTKWLQYRLYYYLWMLFHLSFMVTLTFYAVYKAEDYRLIQPDTTNVSLTTAMPDDSTRRSFLDVFRWTYFVIGVLHVLEEIIHLLFRVKSFDLAQLFNILHNGLYRTILTLFAISLILDCILAESVSSYENYMLIVALITGWWFIVFFLRAHKKFSFFTVMIQKIIFGDMIRFSLIIIVMLVAFTAAIFMTFKGSETKNDELLSFEHTMMLLFKLMLGLGDIEELYEARRPWMAVTLFIVFVVLTYVLMLNALIAMMSQTCTTVSENRHVQWRVQQLSLIMFFEGILPSCLTKMVGDEKHVRRYDPSVKQIIEEKRYFLDMSSLQTEYANAEDIMSMKKLVQTLPFGDYQRTDFFSPYLSVTTPMQNFSSSHAEMYAAWSPKVAPRSPHMGPKSPQSGSNEATTLNKPSTSNNAPTGDDQEHQVSPNIRRRKSKKAKTNGQNLDLGDGNLGNRDNIAPTRQSRKKNRKKCVDPEGDINTSFDDQNRFYLEKEHLTVPSPINMPSPIQGNQERRRYNSEGGLVDTHIGNPMLQQYPITRVQPHSGATNQNSVEIGVIADSYM